MQRAKKKPQRSDRVLLLIGLLALIMGSLFLINPSFFRFGSELGEGAEIGSISIANNDIRRKASGELAWDSVSSDQIVRVGDSVYSGKGSTYRVKLQVGGAIEAGENTMIVFNKKTGTASLGLGDFNLMVKGQMKVMIQGEIVEFEGDGSQVKVQIDGEKKPVVQLLRGQAKIKRQGLAAEDLKLRSQTAKLEENNVAPKEAWLTLPRVTPLKSEDQFTYLTVSDLYEVSKSTKTWNLKTDLAQVNRPLTLKWKREGGIATVYFQTSSEPQFLQAPLAKIEADSYTFAKTPVGTTYWRTSWDQKEWSQTQSFNLRVGLWQDEDLKLVLPEQNVPILQEVATVAVSAKSEIPYEGFVFEKSKDSGFDPRQTEAFVSSKKSIAVFINEPGSYFLRVRGIRNGQELSQYSGIQTLNVIRPLPPVMPRLAQNKILGTVQTPLTVSWTQESMNVGSEYVLTDQKKNVLQKGLTQDLQWGWTPERPGQYQLFVRGLDRYGRRSSQVSRVDLEIQPSLSPVLARAPAQEGQSSMSAAAEIPPYLNREYDSSKFEVEGAVNRIASSEARAINQQAPINATLGIRTHVWRGNNGFEGSFKTKVFAATATEEQTSPMFLEARYHRRVKANWNLFSSLKESQFSVFGGYEMYRSSGSSLYSPKYDLMKTGVAMSFPFVSRWDTGGEFAYGYGTDKSQKGEVSGFLHYYARRDFSMGAGYRVHLFEAGSAATAPSGGLPYREGYGEGYSVLRWHY